MSARLAVRVHPGARAEGVRGKRADGAWQLSVAAPPEGGRANDAVVELVSMVLGLKPRQVRVARGGGSRGKTLEIDGLEPAEIERRMERAARAKDERDGE